MRARIVLGDCLEEMAKLPECSVDAVVTDAPYGLFFMGRNWDHGVPGVPFWDAALRVAKPGAPLLAFGGTRTYHRLTCAIEDAGWEIRDSIGFLHGPLLWVTGQGFPKSHNFGCQCYTPPYEQERPSQKSTNRKGVRVVRGELDTTHEVSGESKSLLWNGVQHGGEEPSPASGCSGIEMRDVRTSVSPPTEPQEARQSLLLAQMLGRDANGAPHGDCWTGANGLDGGQPGARVRENARGEESRMERRGDVQTEQGELHRSEVRSLPGGVHANGASRRLRDGASAGGGQDPRALPSEVRSSASPQSSDEGQLVGEPGPVPNESRAQAIRGSRIAASDVGRCESCGGIVGFSGYGTALKPSFEPIVLAMKPLDGTFAQNAERWGVAGVNVGGCRIDTGSTVTRHTKSNGEHRDRWDGNTSTGETTEHAGRWPANLILDEAAAGMLDESTGGTTHSAGHVKEGSLTPRLTPGNAWQGPGATYTGGRLGDSGGPSRFFYTSKADGEDRGPRNNHPTVKPRDLMRWLCTLVLPPPRSTPRVLLDPFAGSGSTGIGAMLAGWDECILIEREAEYVEIARRRVRDAAPLFVEVGT